MKIGKTGRLLAMLGFTAAFFLVELIVGYMSHSMALVADSYHMMSDVMALLVAFISVRISSRTSSRNTFGWARAEVLGALVNSVFLLALCFSIFVEAIGRFQSRVRVENPLTVLIVGAIGLAVNIVGLLMFHPDRAPNENSAGKDEHIIIPEAVPEPRVSSSSQLNMRAVFLHVLGDALGSVIVIISASVIWLTNWEYVAYIDPAMSILLVCIITYTTIPLLRESALILMQTVPTHIEIDDIKARMLQIEGVHAVHELHIWQLAGDCIIASAHIRCHNLPEYMRLAGRIKQFFHDAGIHSTTMQPEFEDVPPNGDLTDEQKKNQLNSAASCIIPCQPAAKSCVEGVCCKPVSDKQLTENNRSLENHKVPTDQSKTMPLVSVVPKKP